MTKYQYLNISPCLCNKARANQSWHWRRLLGWRRSGAASWSLQRVEQISVPPPQTPSRAGSQALRPGPKVPRCSYPRWQTHNHLGLVTERPRCSQAPHHPHLVPISSISPHFAPHHDIVTCYRVYPRPIRGQYGGHVISLDQWEGSILSHLAWPLGYPPLPAPLTPDPDF